MCTRFSTENALQISYDMLKRKICHLGKPQSAAGYSVTTLSKQTISFFHPHVFLVDRSLIPFHKDFHRMNSKRIVFLLVLSGLYSRKFIQDGGGIILCKILTPSRVWRDVTTIEP